MKNQFRNNLSLFVCLLIFYLIANDLTWAQSKFEGYWEAETIQNSTFPGQPAKKIEKQTVYYKSGNMKIKDLTDKTDMIIRLDEGYSMTVDHNAKTYTVIKFEDMEKGMQQAKSGMAEQMKKMSPEEREQMQKMMGGKMGAMMGGEMPQISFKSTGKSKTIQGYNCSQVLMYLGGDPFMEMWLTKKYTLGDDFLKIYQKMGFIKGQLPKDSDVKGFPIYSKMEMDMGMGKMDSETTVVKLVPTSVSDNEFAAPKGYKKIESKMY